MSNIINLSQSQSTQWSEIAILITVDEDGGFYDSGFIQPVDFFGTGPRIPMIAVSPFINARAHQPRLQRALLGREVHRT